VKIKQKFELNESIHQFAIMHQAKSDHEISSFTAIDGVNGGSGLQ
jgi:hypothetical protein